VTAASLAPDVAEPPSRDALTYRPRTGYLAWLLTQCDRGLARRLDQALRGMDLTEAQYGVLQALARLRRASSAALARAVGVTPQAMVGLVTALERKEYIVRASRAGGGRVIDARLTPAGRAVYEAARRRIKLVDTEVRAALTDADHEHLISLLERLPGVLDSITLPERHRRTASRARVSVDV
jgi:DNA-binding MarR family transcriptional regulator